MNAKHNNILQHNVANRTWIHYSVQERCSIHYVYCIIIFTNFLTWKTFKFKNKKKSVISNIIVVDTRLSSAKLPYLIGQDKQNISDNGKQKWNLNLLTSLIRKLNQDNKKNYFLTVSQYHLIKIRWLLHYLFLNIQHIKSVYRKYITDNIIYKLLLFFFFN